MTAGDDAQRALRRAMSQRRVLRVTPDEILRLLQLPEGSTVLRVQSTHDPIGLEVVIANPGFSQVNDDACAPYLSRRIVSVDNGIATVDYVDHQDGKVYVGARPPGWLQP